MGQVINTNSLSLLTQNNLNKSQGALNTSIQRLSSGLRINSAKDDAAGQAIANRFSANIKGLSQAQRNANDGISLAQTTEGALNEINTNLQRIRELTVQSANGSNSASDQASIQGEITARLDEIDRTSQQTDFNGVKVLANGVAALNIQVGSDDAQVVSINLEEISKSTLKLDNFQVSQKTELSAAVTTANVGAAFSSVAIAVDGNATPTIADGLYALKDGSGYVVKNTLGAYSTATVAAGGGTTWTSGTGTTAAALVDVAGGALTSGKLTATIVPGAGSADSYKAVLKNGVSTGEYVGLTAATGKYTEATFAGTATAIDGTAAAVVLTDATTDPLKALDKALAKVDGLRGSLGAVQNRFDSIISNLGTTITNLSSSRSRIEDADYATEVSNMTRAQILQQAGTSVLAKANQSTQGVMSLLQ